MYLLKRKKFIHRNSYGSIEKKGQHELRRRIIEKIKGKDDIYIAVCDTKQYYPTINHSILMRVLERHIKDKWALWLCWKTINRMKGIKGLALGLATSNILGHVYHSDLDWLITQEYGFRNYFRFCDDKILISRDKNLLHTMVRVLQDEVRNLEQEVKSTWKVVNVKRQRVEILGALMNTETSIITSYKRRSIERRFRKEINRPFNYKTDSYRVLRTWAGLKGSFQIFKS